MADAPKFTEEQLAEMRARALEEITVMDREALTGARDVCVSGAVRKMKTQVEDQFGPGSFPLIDQYCTLATKTAVEKNFEAGLYIDLAIQQLGLGTGLDFKEQGELVGDKPVALLRNIRAAADGGYTSYVDAADKERPLSCALAFDAGATWASANIDKVNRPDLTVAQAEKIASICHTPEIDDVKISNTGKTLTIQQAGLAAGEILGQKWKLELDSASASGVLETTGAIPIPQPAPDRATKAARAVGN